MDNLTTAQRSDSDLAGDPVPRGAIVLRLSELSQLFDPRDPALILERDLSRYAEEYIVDRMREVPPAQRNGLVRPGELRSPACWV